MLDDAEDPKLRRPGWGGLARRGAGGLKRSETYREEDAAKARASRGDRPERGADDRPPRQTDERTARSVRAAADAAAIRGAKKKAPAKAGARKPPAKPGVRKAPAKPGVRKPPSAKRGASGRAPSRRGTSRSISAKSRLVAMSLEQAVGERRVKWARNRFDEAVEAFLDDRFTDARRELRPLADAAPGVAEVRELHGLILYRLGRWSDARNELAAAYALSKDVAQHPVWMDCERAMGEHAEVQRLWDELGSVSPDPATMIEGRIVAAGSFADRGDLAAAVQLVGKGFRRSARPAVHQLRRAYAYADLLDRAGEHIEARELFGWIVQHDARFGDAADRAASLA